MKNNKFGNYSGSFLSKNAFPKNFYFHHEPVLLALGDKMSVCFQWCDCREVWK